MYEAPKSWRGLWWLALATITVGVVALILKAADLKLFSPAVAKDEPPAFAFTFENVDQSQGGPDRYWDYRLWIGNLTSATVRNVEIEIVFSDVRGVSASTKREGARITLANGEWLAPDAMRRLEDDSAARLIVPEMDAKSATQITFRFFTDEKPTANQLIAVVRCPEGAFKRLTPAEWDAIGWK